MTHDRWHVTHSRLCRVNILSKLQLSSFNGLGIWCFEDLEEKDHWINQLMNDKAVCRTAPATLGLLNTCIWVQNKPKKADLQRLGVCFLTFNDFGNIVGEKQDLLSYRYHVSGIICQGSGIGISDQGSGIWDQGSGIRDLGSGIRDQGSGNMDQGTGIREQGTGNCELKTENCEL